MVNFLEDLCRAGVPAYAAVIAAVLTYFLGNINPAIIIGRAKGIDIRAQGSGNAGATNAMRSIGKKAGIVTFLIDVAKGFAGYAIPMAIFHEIPVALLCGLCVVLGHMYPIVFGFRGGKGVSTTFGVLLAVSALYALVLLAIVIVLTAIFRRVSLSVMVAVAAAIIFVFWGGYHQQFSFYKVGFMEFNVYLPMWIIIIMALVVWKHRSNIGRLIKGQEPKLSFKGKGKE